MTAAALVQALRSRTTATIGGVALYMAALAAFLWFLAQVPHPHRDAFMADCERHRPYYECVILWRADGKAAAALQPRSPS